MASVASATAASAPVAPAATAGHAAAAKCPPTAQAARVIGGHHTEVLRTRYADGEFWVVTQCGRVGSVVKATRRVGVEGGETVMCETLFGKRDDPVHDLFARALAHAVTEATLKPLTLAFALKCGADDMEALREVVDFCKSLLQ